MTATNIRSEQIKDATVVDADVASTAAIAWSKISKSGSSLADLATRSAADLTSGVLPVARLPFVYDRLTSDLTINSTTFVDVLTFAIGANEVWQAELHLAITGTTNGVRFFSTGPASPASVLWFVRGIANATTSINEGVGTAFATSIGNFATAAITGWVQANFLVENGANAGTVRLQCATSTGTQVNTILKNSYVFARRVA